MAVTIYTGNGNIRVSHVDVAPPGEVPDAPSWVNSVIPTVGQWEEFSLNTLRDVDPIMDPALNTNGVGNTPPWAPNDTGIDGGLNIWGGGALADPGSWSTHGAMIVGGIGGHNGYHGGESYVLDLGTRLWTRNIDPYIYATTNVWPTGMYPPNTQGLVTPLPSHGQGMYWWHPVHKMLVWGKGCRDWLPGNGQDTLPYSHILDMATREWRRSGDDSGIHATHGNGCYDSVNDCFWFCCGSSSSPGDMGCLYDIHLQNTNGTWGKFLPRQPLLLPAPSTSTSRDPWSGYTSVTHDPAANALYVANFGSSTPSKRFRVYSVVDKVISRSNNAPQAGYPTNADGTWAVRNMCGWQWVPELNAILYCDKTTFEVWKISKPANPYTGTWQWEKISNGGQQPGQPAGGDPNNGLYSRFGVARYANAVVAILVNKAYRSRTKPYVGQPTYAMRIA